MSSFPGRNRLVVKKIGDVTVISFMDSKILDEQNVQITGEQLFDLIDKVSPGKFLLDLRNAEHFSAAMFSMLIVLNRKVENAGKKLVLCNIINNGILEIFRITGMNRHCTVAGNEQEALSIFNSLPG